MSKRFNAKYKIERRFGVSLWGRDKSPVKKRPYAPGSQTSRTKKTTDYGTQLIAKQKLKGYYGNIGEKQFRNLYHAAVATQGDTSANLISLLERRLDCVVYRMKFAVTPFQARQLINHGHILVNGKRINIPSYPLNENDLVEVRPQSKKIDPVLTALALKERTIPDYVEVDEVKVKGRLLHFPALDEVPYGCIMEPKLVIEFYSR